MKRILAMLLALMLVSAMTVGFVAYADEPVAEETPAEIAETAEEQEVAAPEYEIDEESLKYYVLLDASDIENMTLLQLIYSEDEENLNNLAKQLGEEAEYVEFNKKNMLKSNESPVTMDSLTSMGIDCFVEEGFFATKYTYVMLVGNIPEEATQVDDKQFLALKFGKRAASTNGEKISDGAMMALRSGKHCSLMATTYEYNWINFLIALMVLVVIVLIILIAVFSKKKKKLDGEETVADTLENAVEGLGEVSAEIKEEIADAAEEIAEVIEEVKEESQEIAEEVVEEITEIAEEEKTEE